jgi:hypothetical protein
MGLVWGWLLILIVRLPMPTKRPFRTFLALGLATIALSLELYWLADERALLFFVAAALFSLIMHQAWRHSLRAG